MKELGGWQMQKTADALKPGDKIIFSEAMGGEGQVVTVDSIANYFGTVDITTYAWLTATPDLRLNYRLDADDIIKTNPHLLSLTE
jgi:preprotein translocase subunit YajC